ncbi:MAG: beta-glucosidase family protein [Candidatus Helarchaeota archaeon]
MSKKFTKKELVNLPFMNSSLDLEKRVDDLLNRLTLEEKYHISAGRRFFHTKPIKRLGIKSFKMTDGPHGVGALGTYFRKKTTYFPTAICRCATWNPELSKEFGIAIANEVRDIGYHMILGPGVNIQRTPLCGRTFEYQTEDPYLNKVLGVAVVKGVQSRRIAVCVKHFVANNQDTNRFKVSSEVSERALHEIYFPAFEAAVREADAWSFMACYNKVNGIHGCENKYLLTDKLRNEWGFKGFVVSDWFATKNTTSTEACINAGLTLEMPWAIKYKKRKFRKALQKGKFTEKALNENIRRLLRVMILVGLFDDEKTLPKGSRNTPEHQEVARKIAEEGIVLLKNKNNILPLNLNEIRTIAVIGPNADKKLAFGGGSSMIRSLYEITPLKGLKEKCMEKIAINKSPSESDIAIVVVGLNHKRGNDSEGGDRKSFELPRKQIELIEKTVKINPKTIVVLVNGSPIPMDPWIDDVPAVLELWYAGQEGGRALASIIFGDVNPSGKLPITFPKKLTDSPAHKSRKTFPGNEKVFYEEGIFVGYRHFDKENIEPLFPFGYGLSYTTFSFENLQISNSKMSEDDKIIISCDITNSGEREGAEVVQLYVGDVESTVERPPKELKGFKKIHLKPGERRTVNFELKKCDLSFYDENTKSWKAEEGIFKIFIGNSSRNIHLESKIEYNTQKGV